MFYNKNERRFLSSFFSTGFLFELFYTYDSGDIMSKRVKKRIRLRVKAKFLFLVMLVFFSFVYTIKYLDRVNIGIDNDTFLKMLIDDSSNIKTKHSSKQNSFIKYIANLNIFDPVSIITSNYAYLVNKGDSAIESDEEENQKIDKTSSYIENPNPNEIIKDPLVYIYNTHQREDYQSSNSQSYNITPNVMMLSYVLKERLRKLDIPSMVEENDVTEILRINSWNYASSYKVTKMLMEQASNDEPTLKYFIDLHRDSISKDKTTLESNGVKYAKILFVVGLEHENYEKNLKIATELSERLNKECAGISKGVYKKQGKYVNGIYNQDFSSNTMLIEIGGVENNIEEAVNTIGILAKVLAEYIGDNNE